ncbi:MAG: SpoIIE family protein phosphatase [Muribaculaceae bacterium]|nr:SpoIIE family protein phosphatase [Muribaculaceae bacterium]
MATNWSWLDKIRNRKKWKFFSALAIILLAGALIEAMSLIQYKYTHHLMEDELDYRIESELTLKSVRVRSMLKSNERLVRNYQWPIREQIHHNPENIYKIIRRLVTSNHDVMSSFVAFLPDYYPDRGRLFEPSCYRRGDSTYTQQLAGPSHDYTTREFYQETFYEGYSDWSDPYVDTEASREHVTTYAVPLTDDSGKTVAAFGIDMSTQGIIDTLNTMHNYPSTFFLLLTEDGHLISKPDSSHASQQDVNKVIEMINDSTYKREKSSTGHSQIIKFNSEKNTTGYAYYAFMRGMPHWQVVMVCYDNEVFGKLYQMRRNLLLLLLAGFSLLGFIQYRVLQYLRRLNESNLIKERTRSELLVAQNIQAEMLPHQEIHRPDIDVVGIQETALEVGGDLYDYFIRDEKLYFCIGDVSGKGVPSSLVMAVVHSNFRSFARYESNPANIMRSINEIASEGNETNMFVTLFIGVLDLPTGRLRYCNAGHDAPLIINNGVKPLNVNANLPVGLFDDIKYTQQQEQLTDGTSLFLYTDGLTEANDTQHKLFGLQRIIDTALACDHQGGLTPRSLTDTMLQAVHQFSSGAQQSDDLTMLTLQYRQPQEEQVLHQTLTLDNDVKQVPQLNEFVKSVTGQLNLTSSLSSQMMLAVEEAVVNVMNYAYPIGTRGKVTIDAIATAHSLKFVIIDEGKAFDPTQHGDVDTTLSAEDRPIGGLGIMLVQQLMDSINYEYVNNKNILTLKKDYNKQ